MSKDDTLFLNGGGDSTAVQQRAETIRDLIEDTTSDYEREKLQERLARLVGGIAVLKIGGSSEIEVGEKKDRVTDALNATRAAIEEGIVVGGGSALLRTTSALKELKAENFDQQMGIDIVRRAVRAPLAQIAKNARAEPAVIIDKILDSDDEAFGWDASRVSFCYSRNYFMFIPHVFEWQPFCRFQLFTLHFSLVCVCLYFHAHLVSICFDLFIVHLELLSGRVL